MLCAFSVTSGSAHLHDECAQPVLQLCDDALEGAKVNLEARHINIHHIIGHLQEGRTAVAAGRQ